VDFNSACTLKDQSSDRHFPHSETLFLFLANPSLLFLLNAACVSDKQHIPLS